MEQLAVALGKKIRLKRQQRGFSQDRFALAAQVDRSYMGRVERGEANITVEKLYRFARVLGCSPVELLPVLCNTEEDD